MSGRTFDVLLLTVVAVFAGEWLARKVFEWANVMAFRVEMSSL